MHEVQPKTAALFIARLREVEKMEIRMATPDRLEYLRLNDFLTDGPLSFETLIDVQNQLSADFARNSRVMKFGATWTV